MPFVTDPLGVAGRDVDDYHVERLVAEGGFGIVYRAMHTAMDRPRALKFLKMPVTVSAVDAKAMTVAFTREAQIHEDLSKESPAIVRVLHVGFASTRTGKTPYLVMDWLDGVTLSEHLSTHGRVASAADAMTLLSPIALALAVAHDRGVAHRDVKPQNIFLTKAGAKVLDFGIAKLVSDHFVSSTAEGATGPVPRAFTPSYGAPEQFDPRQYGSTGPWTDVFALALVFFEILTCERVLRGNYDQLWDAAVAARKPSFAEAGVDLPAEAEAVLARALATSPRDRFADVRSFWTEMERALGLQEPLPRLSLPRVKGGVAYVYAADDQPTVRALMAYLNGELGPTNWHARPYDPSSSPVPDPEVMRATLVLMFMSPSLVNDGYFDSEEAQIVCDRATRGDVVVLPIALRSGVKWSSIPLRGQVPLPRFGVPMSTWLQREEAFAHVAAAVRLCLDDLSGTIVPAPPHKYDRPFDLYEVFTTNGPPTVTFVETPVYRELKQSLRVPGRGVVLEGPSGVGKTTALRKACAQISLDRPDAPWMQLQEEDFLTARDPAHVARIADLDKWHTAGIVVIDDFHRLDLKLARLVADTMKRLADAASTKRKLVVAGIPTAGKTLVSLGFDLAMRIDVLRFGRVDHVHVWRMLERGESALGVRLRRKRDIALLADGSLNIAQLVAYQTCLLADVDRTQPVHDKPREIEFPLEQVVARLMQRLKEKFATPIQELGRLGGPHDLTAIRLLKNLPTAEDGFLSLSLLKELRPSLASPIARLVSSDLPELYRRKIPDLELAVHFDPTVPALVAEDPQLLLMLARRSFRELAVECGKAIDRPRVVLVHSRYDKDALADAGAFMDELAHEADVEKIEVTPGATWLSTMRAGLDNTAAVVVIAGKVGLDLMRPTIRDLAVLLDDLKSQGRVVRVIRADAPTLFDLQRFEEPPHGRRPRTLWADLVVEVRAALPRFGADLQP
jgi:serine/threonine protein kinase